jgi:hypothetical protein
MRFTCWLMKLRTAEMRYLVDETRDCMRYLMRLTTEHMCWIMAWGSWLRTCASPWDSLLKRCATESWDRLTVQEMRYWVDRTYGSTRRWASWWDSRMRICAGSIKFIENLWKALPRYFERSLNKKSDHKVADHNKARQCYRNMTEEAKG